MSRPNNELLNDIQYMEAVQPIGDMQRSCQHFIGQMAQDAAADQHLCKYCDELGQAHAGQPLPHLLRGPKRVVFYE